MELGLWMEGIGRLRMLLRAAVKLPLVVKVALAGGPHYPSLDCTVLDE